VSFTSRVIAAVLCTMALTATCVAQAYTNFEVLSSSDTMAANPNWQGGRIWSVDVNNDGIPDLIQEAYDSQHYGGVALRFGVSIANGDGTFQAPVGYDIPPGFLNEDRGVSGNGNLDYGGIPIAFGDFNGDGNVDLAMWGGYLTVAVYLGNGDGTFQNPWYSNISLTGNQTVNPFVRFAVSDFNHDGHVDLAIAGVDPDTVTSSVYILPGNGSGLFSTALPVSNFGRIDATHFAVVDSLLVGDYDSDNNADLTVATNAFHTSQGNDTDSAVHVLYGNGDLTFQDTTPILSFFGSIGSGDLNSDGYSDLFVVGSADQQNGLLTFYGRGDRSFAAYTQQIPSSFVFNDHSLDYPAMADFNDDGLMDLVVETHDYSNNGYLLIFLANGSLGQFQYQTWNLDNIYSASGYSGLAVGDFNGDGAPDWVNHYYTSNQSSVITTGLNTTPIGEWSNCPYPIAGRGISVCSPSGSSTSPADFNVTAHSFGKLRKLEVWVDENKLNEQHHTWGGNAFLNFKTSSLAPGAHNGAVYAADIDNTLQRYDFNFNVGPSTCGAPPSPGVNICSPTNGSTTSGKAVQVQATATIQGTLARMEIWADAVKEFTETDSTSMSASINLRSGVHEITVFAVNTGGTLWQQTITVMVP
jgi:hypothetical protein